METKIICENKRNGIFYTPKPLAEFLVKPLIKTSGQTIFDPAYGDGALLIAAEEIIRKRIKKKKIELPIYGCDKQPINGKLSHLPESHLSKQDFFDYSLENKYDIIIMNPPYVRHHLINDEEREKYRGLISPLFNLKLTSDLWAYFLVKSVGHLKEMGCIGAILPWSFLQADYAKNIRIWLLDKFEEIKILALGSEYFDRTEERVLLVWLKGCGHNTRSIKISFSQKINGNLTYMDLDKKTWQSSPSTTSDRDDIEAIIQRYIKQYSFLRLGKIASVRIGVVTGADKFFILPESAARNRGFKEEQLIPILCSAKEFVGFHLNGKNPLKRLLVFSKDPYEHELSYIKEGEQQGFHQRAHSLLRTPWYNVDTRELPDAFFPYRMAKFPYLMLNNQAQCTNSIHRLYFRNLSKNEIRWLQVSLLSVPGQLSIERYSKTYGRGVLKMEPGSLKNSIVYLSNEPSIIPIYNQISDLLFSGKKSEAMKRATRFLIEKLKINRTHSKSAASALHELQIRRLGK